MEVREGEVAPMEGHSGPGDADSFPGIIGPYRLVDLTVAWY